jgi:hypothetical protein
MLSSRDHGTSYISKRKIRFANEERTDVQLVKTVYIARISGFSGNKSKLRNQID